MTQKTPQARALRGFFIQALHIVDLSRVAHSALHHSVIAVTQRGVVKVTLTTKCNGDSDSLSHFTADKPCSTPMFMACAQLFRPPESSTKHWRNSAAQPKQKHSL
jgi:hypothetical protein